MTTPGESEGFVKRVICHACGAPKLRKSETAFVYCDFCAVLTDWDFQVAIGDPRSKLPGPAYEAILKRLAPDLAAALAAGDRERYRTLQREIFAAYVEACPASCPPRCADPAYRTRYVEYHSESATIGAFDPGSARKTAALQKTVEAIEWTRDASGAAKISPASFWRMYDALAASMIPEGDPDHPALKLVHPDGAPIALLRKMAMSMFVQGWIPYLDEKESHALLARTGLATEYVQAPRVSEHAASCGHCGHGLRIPDGAKRSLCPACGYVVDAARPPIPCRSCGGSLTIPEGANVFACAFCKTELRAMRW